MCDVHIFKKWNPNTKCTYTKDIKQTLVQHFLPHEVLVNNFRIPLLNFARSFSIFTVQSHIYNKMYNIVDWAVQPSLDFNFNSLVV